MPKKSIAVMTSLVTMVATTGCNDQPPQDVCENWLVDDDGGYVCDDDGEFIDIDGKKKKKKGYYYYGGSYYNDRSVAASSGAFSKSSGFGSGSKGSG